jgi:hypothetical protein
MGDNDDPDLVRSPPRRTSRWSVALVLLALVVGGGAGYLVRVVTEPTPTAAPPPTAPPAVPPPPSPGPDLSPCTQIAQSGADLVAQLDRAAQAIGALDPAALRDVLTEIRQIRDDVQGQVEQCRERIGTTAPTPPTPGG